MDDLGSRRLLRIYHRNYYLKVFMEHELVKEIYVIVILWDLKHVRTA